MLQVENLTLNIQSSQILKDINLEIAANEFVGLIDPNGNGKSSLLRCIYRIYKPNRGRIILNNQIAQAEPENLPSPPTLRQGGEVNLYATGSL